MGNISLKRVVADTLATYISDNIPGLSGKVSAVAAGPETNAPCLAVKIIPSTMSYEAAEPQEVYYMDPDDGKVVVDVGQFTGMISINLYAASVPEREEYEQKILDLFLSSTWSQGTLYLNTPNLIINGYASLYPADFKVFLENEEWSEEFAFESRRYSFIDVSIDFPALTTYDAATLVSLQVALANMDDEIASIDDVELDDRVEVQEDGSTLKGTV